MARPIGGLRANASTQPRGARRSRGADDGDPADLAARYAALRELPNPTVAGGCCGTDIRHVTATCDACMD